MDVNEVYNSILEEIDGISVLITKNSVNGLEFGQAFTFSFNNELLCDLLNSSDFLDYSVRELFLSEIEKNRIKYLKKYRADSIPLSFVIIKNLILIARNENDLRFLNICLKFLDKVMLEKWCLKQVATSCAFLIKQIKMVCEILIAQPEISESEKQKNDACRVFTDRILTHPNMLLNKNEKYTGEKKIVVFSPNMYSLYTLSVLELLVRAGFKIEAVVVRKLFNVKRIRQEISRDGKRLVKKIIRKLIFKDSHRNNDGGRNLSDVKNELNIKCNNVHQFCDQYGIMLLKCGTLNDNVVMRLLDKIQADYGIFTGGGIVSSEVLKAFKISVLNCHAGILPHYRGMDVIEWPTLLNDSINTGATVHFMTEGIDEGEILYGYRVEKKLNVISARMELESYAPYLQIKSLIDHINGKIFSEQQSVFNGRSYYVMHPWLFNKAVEISRNNEG